MRSSSCWRCRRQTSGRCCPSSRAARGYGGALRRARAGTPPACTPSFSSATSAMNGARPQRCWARTPQAPPPRCCFWRCFTPCFRISPSCSTTRWRRYPNTPPPFHLWAGQISCSSLPSPSCSPSPSASPCSFRCTAPRGRSAAAPFSPPPSSTRRCWR